MNVQENGRIVSFGVNQPPRRHQDDISGQGIHIGSGNGLGVVVVTELCMVTKPINLQTAHETEE